jgi:hypothetical protein
MTLFWNKNKTTENRRKRERVAFHLPVKLLVPSLAAMRGEGYVDVRGKNISIGGLLVHVNRSYPTLVPCRVRLDFDSHLEGIIVDGMIIWADEKKAEGIWELGISFINMPEDHRATLQKYIQQSS